MRRIHSAIAGLLSVLLVLMVVPSTSASATHTEFVGVYFPAGMPETDSDCPYTWVDPAFCIIERGTWTELDGGELRIRNLVVYELAFAWNAEDPSIVEPRKTGYDVVTADADLDASLSGPTWGTWKLYSFEDELMFSGTFTGYFENGIPEVHFVGQGIGSYEGQHMSGDVGRIPDPYNMTGRILEMPSS